MLHNGSHNFGGARALSCVRGVRVMMLAMQLFAYALIVLGVALAMYERGANAAVERFEEAEREERRHRQVVAARVALALAEEYHELTLYRERSRLIDSHVAIARIERALKEQA